MWIYVRPDDSCLTLGEYDKPDGWEGALLTFTKSLEVAQSWARELRAGRPPVESDPGDPLEVARSWAPDVRAGPAPVEDDRAPDSLH